MSIGCPKCGSSKANSDTDYECPDCGNKFWRSKKYFDEHLKEYKIQQAGVAEYEKNHLIKNIMKCNNCGKKNPDDSKFCVHCGVKVDSIKKVVEEKKPTKKNDIPKTVSEIQNHLEFIGYEIGDNVEEENGTIRFLCVNKSRSNLLITFFPVLDFFIFAANYKIIKATSSDKKITLLNLINTMNNNSAISSFSVGDDFDIFTCATSCPNYYNKKNFSNLIEVFEGEIQNKFQLEDFSEFLTS